MHLRKKHPRRTFIVGLVVLALGMGLLIKSVSAWIWVPVVALLGPVGVQVLWGGSGARYYYFSKKFWPAVDQNPDWFRGLFLNLAAQHPGVKHVQVPLATAELEAQRWEEEQPGGTAYLLAPPSVGEPADCIQVDLLTKLSFWPNWQRMVWNLYQIEMRSGSPDLEARVALNNAVKQISENVRRSATQGDSRYAPGVSFPQEKG